MAITLDGTNGVTTPDLTVDTNTIKVDATNNRVGIGTSSPTTALTLGTSHTATVQNGGSVSAPSYGIVSGAIGVNGTYVPAPNTLGFVVGGGERGRFTANGLTFNGDTAAANALDDYEEGTWSAELRGATARASTPVISTTAKYRKIGDLVFVAVYFANVNTSGASGNLQITGFPFPAINQLFGLDVQTYGQNYDDSTGVMGMKMYIENTSDAILLATKDNAPWQVTGITAGSGKYLAMQGHYIATS